MSVIFKEPYAVPFPRPTPRGWDFLAAGMRSGSSRPAGALRDPRLSSQLVLSMVWSQLPVAGRWAAHAGKASPVSPHHPVSPPPPPASLSAPTARTGAVARPAARGGGWSPSPCPRRVESCSPAEHSRWAVPRSNPRAAGESTWWGGGGEPGSGAAARWARQQLLGGEPCILSWVWARAKCGFRLALGYRCSLPWRPAERPEPGSGWGVSATPGPVLWSGLGLAPRGLRSPPEGSQAEKILDIAGTAMGCHLAPSVGRVRCCLPCSGVSLLNSDFQPAE